MTATIHDTRHGDHVVVITIDNPPMNPLGEALRSRMIALLDGLEQDHSVRCVVIAGQGANFCTGEDLKEREPVNGVRPPLTDVTTGFGAMLARIENSRFPVIAAINGWCIGGGLELALACDIRIASTKARFVCAGVNVGLMASAWRLPRTIGMGPAKAMLLTGLPTSAEKAERIGLVASLHDETSLMAEAVELASRIASRAPLSVEATKSLASRAPDLTPQEARAIEAGILPRLSGSEDHSEALAAFKEKREPLFKRR